MHHKSKQFNMNLRERIELAGRLRSYMQSEEPDWMEAQQRAFERNPWFIPEFIRSSVDHICDAYLDPEKLESWARTESIPSTLAQPKTVGLVMASNLPLVGFHDWLCTWMVGHQARIKLSAQDQVLFQHLAQRLAQWDPRMAPYLQLADRLSGADAYIATGSDNTSRYFDYYFGRYPHLIRKNRTSVARLTGDESPEELEALSADMYQYFGRGCRNVTHLLVPRDYDFKPLLEAGRSFQFLSDHHKYKNNYDYQLAICILNKEYYMTNGICLFVERPALNAPIALVQFQYYDRAAETDRWLATLTDQVQCLVSGKGGVRFGMAQHPALTDYADGVNPVKFLCDLELPR